MVTAQLHRSGKASVHLGSNEILEEVDWTEKISSSDLQIVGSDLFFSYNEDSSLEAKICGCTINFRRNLAFFSCMTCT